jgi:hypothetical protein
MANALCISNNALLIRNNALSIGCGGGGPSPGCFGVIAQPCDRLLQAPPGQNLPAIDPITVAWPWVATMTETASGSRAEREFPVDNPSLFDEVNIVTTRPRQAVRQWAFVMRARLNTGGSLGPWLPDLPAIQSAYPFVTSDAGVTVAMPNSGDGTYDVGYSLHTQQTFDAGESIRIDTNNGVQGSPTTGPALVVYANSLSQINATTRSATFTMPVPFVALPPWYTSIPGRPSFWQLEYCDSVSVSGSPFGSSSQLTTDASWGFVSDAAGLDYSGSVSATGSSTSQLFARQWDSAGSFGIATDIDEAEPVTIPGYPSGAPGPSQALPDCFGSRPAPPTDPRVAALSPENNVCKGCGE